MPFTIRALRLITIAAAGATALSPLAAQRKPDSGPVARYDMRAGTITGAGAMGRGAGGAMGMMFGGGGGDRVLHELYLRLGSDHGPDKGAPKADHFMPPPAKLGKSVPLVTPQAEKIATDEMPSGQKPRGRLLIFWGCGEHSPQGQPVVIDFARLAEGHVPPGLWSSTILRDWGPTLANSRAFGRWPNEDAMGGNRQIRPDASLIGPHRVAGNYTPDMTFTLGRDFMGGLQTSTSSLPSGASILRWTGLTEATGYLAALFGGKMGPGGQMGDMVMWSSSGTRQFGGGLSDWLSPGQVAGLVGQGVVLPPSKTSCTIPAEVRAAAPDFRMGMLTAYGPEEDFAYPARPTDPKVRWDLLWTARIRHRSMTSWMDMPGMGGSMGGDPRGSNSGAGQNQGQANCRPRGGLGGIGGMLGGGLLGGRSGC